MVIKARCPRCNGRKSIDLDKAGIFQAKCDVCKGTGEADIVPELYANCEISNPNYQNGNEVFVPLRHRIPNPDGMDGNGVIESADKGSDKGSAGSDKGEAAGGRQNKGKEAKKKVRKGTKPLLPSTRKKPTVSGPPRVP